MTPKIKLLLSTIITTTLLSSSAFASAGAGTAAAGAPVYWDTIDEAQQNVATELNQRRLDISGPIEVIKESANSMDFIPAAEFRATPYTAKQTIVERFDKLDGALAKSHFPDQGRIQDLITGYRTTVIAALKGLEGIVQDFKGKPLTVSDTLGTPNASYTTEEVEAFQGAVDGYIVAVRAVLPEDFDAIKKEIFLNYGGDKNPDVAVSRRVLAERAAKLTADPAEQERIKEAARLAAERAEQERIATATRLTAERAKQEKIKAEMRGVSEGINERVQAKIRGWTRESSMAVTAVSKEDGVFADLEKLFAYCFPGDLPEFMTCATPYMFSAMYNHLDAWGKDQGGAQESLPQLGTLLSMYSHAGGDIQELIRDQGTACMNGLNGRLFQKVLEKCAHSPKLR